MLADTIHGGVAPHLPGCREDRYTSPTYTLPRGVEMRHGFEGTVRVKHHHTGDQYYITVPKPFALRVALQPGQPVRVEMEV